MALADTFRRLPPWAVYAGAAGVGGGAFLYWRRRKAAAGAATPAAATTPLNTTTDSTTGQGPSIVPYYLTADPNAGGTPPTAPPPVRRAQIPAGTSVATTTTPNGAGAVLPPIPPLLPVSPAAPTSPAPPPAPSVAPTAAPGANNNIPPDLLAQIQQSGERIVGQLTDPRTGGTWWLGSYGGIFAEGGARFLGSARNNGFGPGAPRTAIAIQPLGTGYRIVSSRGENYDYPG